MAKLVWTVVCQRSVIDKETNKLSLIDSLEMLAGSLIEPLSENAIFPIPFSVVSYLVRSNIKKPEIAALRIQLRVNGRKVWTQPEEMKGDLKSAPRARVAMNSNGFPYFGNGTYEFVTQQRFGKKWRAVFSNPIEVSFNVAEPQSPARTETAPNKQIAKKSRGKATSTKRSKKSTQRRQ
jgi:hypothetical protein